MAALDLRRIIFIHSWSCKAAQHLVDPGGGEPV